MKKLGFLLLFSMLLLSAQNVVAQKIAYVDVQSIFPEMPEYKKAQSELKAFAAQLEKLVQQKQLEMITTEKKIKEDYPTTTPKDQQVLIQKLKQMEQDLYVLVNESEQKLVKKELELKQPIYTKINQAVQAVAAKNDYAYVADKAAFIYVAGGIDATEKVRTELGLSW